MIAGVSAAIAALAAAGATLLQFALLRQSKRPSLSLVITGHGTQQLGLLRTELGVANAGPGMAVATGLLFVDDDVQWKGPIGDGHLLPGQKAALFTNGIATERARELAGVYRCRDVDGHVHMWSNDGRYRRAKASRRNPDWSLDQCFALMYPGVKLPGIERPGLNCAPRSMP